MFSSQPNGLRTSDYPVDGNFNFLNSMKKDKFHDLSLSSADNLVLVMQRDVDLRFAGERRANNSKQSPPHFSLYELSGTNTVLMTAYKKDFLN